MLNKKNNVKEKIKQTAQNILFDRVYKDMSMRDVASTSDMAVGNIYRYYKNKEILFDDIVKGTYNSVIKLVKMTDFVQKFMKNKQGTEEKSVFKTARFKTFVLKQITKFICDNASEFYILINSSEGSKYEGFSEMVCDIIQETITKMISDISADEADTYAFVVISTVSYLLKKHINQKEILQESLIIFCKKLFSSF